jgi:hypothetical protein
MIIGGSLNIGQIPAFSTGGSLSFNGSNQYLSVSNSAGAPLGSGAFTIECWFYQTAIGANPNSLIFMWKAANGRAFQLYTGNSLGAGWNTSGGMSGGVTTTNTWYHGAFVSNGTNFYLYLNGQQVATAAAVSISASSDPVIIGANNDSASPVWNHSGYITNIRIVKGTAVYTGNFNPSSQPLTNITNTSLLLTVSTSGSALTDSSTNNFSISNGNGVAYNTSTPFTSVVPAVMSIGSTPSAAPPTIEYLVVAGGGGGTGVASGNAVPGGGGGAGGVVYQAAFPVSSGFLYTITVGGGGAAVSVGAACNAVGTVGNDSSINSLVVAKGGGGSGYYTTGGTGGSGGGGGYNGSAGGGSNQSSAGVIPSGAIGYGNAGGAGGGIGSGGGGGGGASSAGSASPQAGGVGGVGTATTIISTSTAQSLNVGQVSGAFVYFAGGGAGGGAYNATTTITAGPLGGGGAGGNTTTAAGSGINYTGGGGGSAPNTIAGGKGGSGVIIIRYPNTYSNAASTTGVGVNLVNANGYITYIFTSSGSITF